MLGSRHLNIYIERNEDIMAEMMPQSALVPDSDYILSLIHI